MECKLSDYELMELNQKCLSIMRERDEQIETEIRQRCLRRKPHGGRIEARRDLLLQAHQDRKARSKPVKYLPRIHDEYVAKIRKLIAPHFGAGTEGLSWVWTSPYIELIRCALHLLFVDQRYQELQSAIRQISPFIWPKRLHGEVRDLWDNSSYCLDEKSRQKALNSVARYRIRRDKRCPLGVARYGFDPKDREYLLAMFSIDQRPSTERKKEMSQETGLDLAKISNFFKNCRQRIKNRRNSLSSTSSGTLCASQMSAIVNSQPASFEQTLTPSEIIEKAYVPQQCSSFNPDEIFLFPSLTYEASSKCINQDEIDLPKPNPYQFFHDELPFWGEGHPFYEGSYIA